MLDRLIYAGVFTSQAVMVEERFYGYDKIGNLLSTRLTYQSASLGRGAFHVGDRGSSANFQSTYNFNSLSGLGLASSNYKVNGDSPYIVGAFGPPANGQKDFTIGSMQSGSRASSSSYESVFSFNAMSGNGAATTYKGNGITPYVRGFNSNIGHSYSGPYSETLINYTYPNNHDQPHAVSSRSNGDSFTYDDNGNMTQRIQNGVTWTQVFDDENHLTSVSDGSTTTTYVYDGSGARIKQIVDDGSTEVTTIYVAGMEIELHDAMEDHRTIYYAAGGAFRVVGGADAGLYYRHTDNLGSTSVISDSSGNKVPGSDAVFAPFGEIRSGALSTLTDFGYTGQRLDRDSGGLMYYGARYYLPGVNRFISADTIVPGAGDPQGFNRYTYTSNNPIRYTDPTGHMTWENETGYCATCRHEASVAYNNAVEQSSAVSGGGGDRTDPTDLASSSGGRIKHPWRAKTKDPMTYGMPSSKELYDTYLDYRNWYNANHNAPPPCMTTCYNSDGQMGFAQFSATMGYRINITGELILEGPGSYKFDYDSFTTATVWKYQNVILNDTEAYIYSEAALHEKPGMMDIISLSEPWFSKTGSIQASDINADGYAVFREGLTVRSGTPGGPDYWSSSVTIKTGPRSSSLGAAAAGAALIADLGGRTSAANKILSYILAPYPVRPGQFDSPADSWYK